MRTISKLHVVFTRKEVDALLEELEDIGLGVDNGEDEKQGDEKYPTLSLLNEYLQGEQP